jgi:hypothetical protein
MNGLCPANLTVRYTFRCDFCGAEESEEWRCAAFNPVLFPSMPKGWQEVRGNPVCPNHEVSVVITSRPRSDSEEVTLP